VETRLIDAGDAKLHVREWGPEDGRPLLFWHALGDHTSLQAAEAAPVLAQEYGLRVVAVDAPGFGGSPRLADERYEMASLVELARGALDGLGLERAVWMGSSWGAALGVHLTAAHPERIEALVLLDGGYQDAPSGFGVTLRDLRKHWRSQPELWSHDSWEAIDVDARQYFRRWSPALAESCRSAYRERDGKIFSIMGPDVYAAAIWGMIAAPPAEALPRLGASGVPVLLLAAAEPPELAEQRRPARERFAALVPQADVRLVDTMHFVMEDAPEETARQVGDWLGGQT
jgi:pimeloyl-ACP methyl ester carboxylesterase